MGERAAALPTPLKEDNGQNNEGNEYQGTNDNTYARGACGSLILPDFSGPTLCFCHDGLLFKRLQTPPSAQRAYTLDGLLLQSLALQEDACSAEAILIPTPWLPQRQALLPQS